MEESKQLVTAFDVPALLTRSDLAGLLKLSGRTVGKLITSGDLPAPIRIGRSHRWRAQDVEQYLVARPGVGRATNPGPRCAPGKASQLMKGPQTMQANNTCNECGAKPGELHRRGCGVEPCPNCGRPLSGCGCSRKDSPPPYGRMPWTGEWPGAKECREFGWYARLEDGKGWVPCGPHEPGATEDLNRLRTEGRWDRQEKRWVKD